MQSLKPARKSPRNLKLNDSEKIRREHYLDGGGWHKQDEKEYINKIKKMNASELGREIHKVKTVLADTSTADMEHRTIALKTKAAYKLSAIMSYLRYIL